MPAASVADADSPRVGLAVSALEEIDKRLSQVIMTAVSRLDRFKPPSDAVPMDNATERLGSRSVAPSLATDHSRCMSPTSPEKAKPVQTELVVTLDDPSQRSSLYAWMNQSEELHGQFAVVPVGARPGELGADLEIMRLLLESGGVVTVLISSIVLWLKSRRSDVSVEVSVGRNKIKLSSRSLRNASVEDLERLVRGVTRELTGQ